MKDTKVKTGSSVTQKQLIGQDGDARSSSAQDFLSVKFKFVDSFLFLFSVSRLYKLILVSEDQKFLKKPFEWSVSQKDPPPHTDIMLYILFHRSTLSLSPLCIELNCGERCLKTVN